MRRSLLLSMALCNTRCSSAASYSLENSFQTGVCPASLCQRSQCVHRPLVGRTRWLRGCLLCLSIESKFLSGVNAQHLRAASPWGLQALLLIKPSHYSATYSGTSPRESQIPQSSTRFGINVSWPLLMLP